MHAETEAIDLTLVTPAELTLILMHLMNGISPELDVQETDIALERPRNREHGDWASSVAMKFAKRISKNPRELADTLAEQLG